MDSWLVGAAAAAVYFAELRTRMAETGNVPFCGLAPRRELRKDVTSNGREASARKVSDSYGLNVVPAAEVDSTSGFDSDMVGSSGHCVDNDLISQSCLVPGSSKNQNLSEDRCRKGPTIYSYGHLHKPLSSVDSCLMAQLYMQHVKMQEYMSASIPSPPTAISRPLILTDGSELFSRASGGFSTESNGTMESRLRNQASFEKSGYKFGIPSLPEIKSSDLSKKLKFKRGNWSGGGGNIPCKVDTETQFRSQREGPDEGAVLFCLGISIGIISSYIGNQREVSELRGLLNHKENVVQDLRDELEMKDSVTVKEIANEKYESRETYDDLSHDRATISSSVEQNFNNSKQCYGRESYYEKVEGSSESMSQIEAELEAELGRLGLNMNVSNPESRLSDLVELDPDFVAELVEGELRSDMVNTQAFVESVSDEDRGGTSTTHSGNYAVSPRELTSRLHKLIQSKLEKRIEELETALQNSQMKVKLLESQNKSSRKIFNSEWKYKEESDCLSDPLVMKLSGEAREELLKTDEWEEEDDAQPVVYQNDQQHEQRKYDRNEGNGSFLNLTQYSKNTWEESVYGQGSRSEDLYELSYVDEDEDEDECSDSVDEMEKQLIEKIVKKTKEDSHALLNAQRILFSLDEV